METDTRRIVIHEDFDRAVVDLLHAFQDEGLQVVGRIDVAEQFKRPLGPGYPRHLVFEVWCPDLVEKALRLDLELGTLVMTRFAIYAHAGDQTTVAAAEGLAPLTANREFRAEHPRLVALAAAARERAFRVLSRLQAHNTVRSAA